MRRRVFRPRDLIIDNCEREAIVLSEADAPPVRWLEKQKDERVRECAKSRWWDVIPLSGGEATAPEPLCKLLRVATVDDLRAAVACAMPAGVTTLLELFPEISKEPFIIGRSLIAKSPIRSVRFRFERGDPTLTEQSVRRAEMIVVSFVERVVVSTEPANAQTALNEAVLALNSVVGAESSSGLSLAVDERDRLVEFLVEVAQTGGMRVRQRHDPTRKLRTW
jgi:hypothetical protein